jgi:hypothetical protein
MAVFRRNKTYWTDFSVNGQRFRQSLDTTDWREALRREKERIAQAQTGKLSAAGQSFARLAFTEAADRYLDSRKIELSARSLEKERQLLVHPRLGVPKLQAEGREADFGKPVREGLHSPALRRVRLD